MSCVHVCVCVTPDLDLQHSKRRGFTCPGALVWCTRMITICPDGLAIVNATCNKLSWGFTCPGALVWCIRMITICPDGLAIVNVTCHKLFMGAHLSRWPCLMYQNDNHLSRWPSYCECQLYMNCIRTLLLGSPFQVPLFVYAEWHNHLSRWPSYSESHLCRWLSCLFQAWPPINVWSPSQLKAIWPSFSEVGQLSWSWQLKAEQAWPCCACSRNTWLSFPKQEDMGDLGAKDMTWYVILMQPAKHKTSKSLKFSLHLSLCRFLQLFFLSSH